MERVPYGAIVVGGGIAGTCSAIALAEAGVRTLLVEHRKLGAEASGANEGVIHSGAAYVLDRPEHAEKLRDAMPLWTEFVTASPGETWLLTASRRKATQLRTALQHLGVESRDVDQDELFEVLRVPYVDEQYAIAVREHTVDPIDVMQHLAQRCLDLFPQLEVVIDCKVQAVVASSGEVEGIEINDQLVVSCNVVLSAGAGNTALLRSIGHPDASNVVSSHTVLSTVANRGLSVSLRSLDEGGVVAVPHGDIVHISTYAAPQSPHPSAIFSSTDENDSSIYAIAAKKLATAGQWIKQIDCRTSTYVPVAKPEFHLSSSVTASKFQRNPNSAVVSVGGVKGLYIAMAGKFTFGPIVAQEVVRLLVGDEMIRTPIRRSPEVTENAVDLVHSNSWKTRLDLPLGTF